MKISVMISNGVTESTVMMPSISEQLGAGKPTLPIHALTISPHHKDDMTYIPIEFLVALVYLVSRATVHESSENIVHMT